VNLFTYNGLITSRVSHHWLAAILCETYVVSCFTLLRWEKPGHSPQYGYDFWYQPRHNTMISTSWGAPRAFTKGFNLEHVSDGLYGRHLHVYDWPGGELRQTLDLGDSGLLPLEASFYIIRGDVRDAFI